MLLLFVLLLNCMITGSSLEELYSQTIEAALAATVPQLILATLASGERYNLDPEENHQSLALFVAGIEVLEKYYLVRTDFAAKLFIEITEEALLTNEEEIENNRNTMFNATDKLKHFLAYLEENYSHVKDLLWIVQPEVLTPINNLLTIVGSIKNGWELSTSELTEMLSYMDKYDNYEEGFKVEFCDACDEYKTWIIENLDKKLNKPYWCKRIKEH
jgi:hypothetical protein